MFFALDGVLALLEGEHEALCRIDFFGDGALRPIRISTSVFLFDGLNMLRKAA